MPALRASHGWSQGELAARLGVSRQTVNAIETGKYDPSLPLAFKLAHLFAQPIERIFEPDDGSRDEATYDGGAGPGGAGPGGAGPGGAGA